MIPETRLDIHHIHLEAPAVLRTHVDGRINASCSETEAGRGPSKDSDRACGQLTEQVPASDSDATRRVSVLPLCT